MLRKRAFNVSAKDLQGTRLYSIVPKVSGLSKEESGGERLRVSGCRDNNLRRCEKGFTSRVGASRHSLCHSQYNDRPLRHLFTRSPLHYAAIVIRTPAMIE